LLLIGLHVVEGL
jgi:hypothetical protein